MPRLKVIAGTLVVAALIVADVAEARDETLPREAADDEQDRDEHPERIRSPDEVS